MRQCAHERHLAEALCQEQPKFLGTSLHGRTRFVSPFCGMSKKRNRKRAVATQDKENSLNEKRKRRLEGKSRESEKADGRPSGSAGDSASLSFSARLALLTACACLRRGAAEPHLSMTSTRRGIKKRKRLYCVSACKIISQWSITAKCFTVGNQISQDIDQVRADSLVCYHGRRRRDDML